MTSAIDSLDDVTTVHDAATRALDAGDHPLAYGLLQSLYDSPLVTDARWTTVRRQLGEACWHLQDLDAARRFLDEATVGQGEDAEVARRLLAQLDQQVSATTASADGVGADEVVAVHNAAGEAMLRGDYEEAIALFERLYANPGLDAMVMGGVLLALGQCHLALGRYDQAKEWLQGAVQFGDAMYAEPAKADLETIATYEAAVGMAQDGATVPELRAIFDAATGAYERHDTQAAEELWTSLLANPVLPPTARGATLVNLAQCAIRDGRFDDARSLFDQAVAVNPEMAGIRDERVTMLENRDEAIALAGLATLD